YDWEVYPENEAIDTFSARPNFSVLMYPVISFLDSIAHSGTRTNLLGDPVTELQKDSFSTELHVDAMTPPAFLFHSKLDGSVKYQNSVVYANALTDAGVSNSLNLYASGGHGVGKCLAGSTDFSRWPVDLDAWLVEEGWTTPCLGETPAITVVEDDSIRLFAPEANSYQWYRNGILLTGATDSVYVPVIIGNYKVAVPGMREGSGSDCLLFSEEVVVDALLNNTSRFGSPLRIYPNPTSGKVQVEGLGGNQPNGSYELFNLHGQRVAQGVNIPLHQTLQLDFSRLATGMYYLRIQTKSQLWTGRFYKQ
ncbi:MAG: T9SS type A sorting domain-containing protein, partial [Phaeodactylibacter sp.]|nr:T9SS type A sorting domain-containing protein [Phaeodactylibacter sp.]